jgi:hypothetical protein
MAKLDRLDTRGSAAGCYPLPPPVPGPPGGPDSAKAPVSSKTSSRSKRTLSLAVLGRFARHCWERHSSFAENRAGEREWWWWWRWWHRTSQDHHVAPWAERAVGLVSGVLRDGMEHGSNPSHGSMGAVETVQHSADGDSGQRWMSLPSFVIRRATGEEKKKIEGMTSMHPPGSLCIPCDSDVIRAPQHRTDPFRFSSVPHACHQRSARSPLPRAAVPASMEGQPPARNLIPAPTIHTALLSHPPFFDGSSQDNPKSPSRDPILFRLNLGGKPKRREDVVRVYPRCRLGRPCPSSQSRHLSFCHPIPLSLDRVGFRPFPLLELNPSLVCRPRSFWLRKHRL